MPGHERSPRHDVRFGQFVEQPAGALDFPQFDIAGDEAIRGGGVAQEAGFEEAGVCRECRAKIVAFRPFPSVDGGAAVELGRLKLAPMARILQGEEECFHANDVVFICEGAPPKRSSFDTSCNGVAAKTDAIDTTPLRVLI